MANMFPGRIPDFLRTDTAHAAECEVYHALLETLSDDYTVFGWVSWVARRPHQGAQDGEADFVIAHPDRGVLVLEVKGGEIAHDARTGTWTSRSRTGEVHPLRRPPHVQARSNRFALERKLQDMPGGFPERSSWGWAVAFPDCAMPAIDPATDVPRDVLVTSADLGRMDDRIAAILHYWRNTESDARPPGREGIAQLEKLLAQSFSLRVPTGVAIREDSRRLIELTETQFRLLDALARNRRMLVTGGAGTGKTLLAIEKAKRLARDQGFRTLFTCFNQPLAEFLAASVGEVPNLTVTNFHDLCAAFGRRIGREIPDPLPRGRENEFYRHDLPAMLVDALAELPDRFDAIVLDEGQDFSATDRAALELALEDRDQSVLYVFQDETQAIYRDGSAWPERDMATYVLTENRRNTKAIHGVLGQLVDTTRTEPIGPDGIPPEFVLAADPRAEARELSRVLHRLVREQGVSPAAIAVLVSSRTAIPDLVEGGRVGAFEVTDSHADAGDKVLVESVTRFKGLERDVVVLVRLDPVHYCEYVPMLYVGASRARAHLVVIGSEAVLARFRG